MNNKSNNKSNRFSLWGMTGLFEFSRKAFININIKILFIYLQWYGGTSIRVAFSYEVSLYSRKSKLIVTKR